MRRGCQDRLNNGASREPVTPVTAKPVARGCLVICLVSDARWIVYLNMLSVIITQESNIWVKTWLTKEAVMKQPVTLFSPFLIQKIFLSPSLPLPVSLCMYPGYSKTFMANSDQLITNYARLSKLIFINSLGVSVWTNICHSSSPGTVSTCHKW